MTGVTDLLSDRKSERDSERDHDGGRTAPPRVAAAHSTARAAALAAGVTVDSLDSVGQLEDVRRLYERVWRTGEHSPPVTADLLRAMATAGSYVSGAFDGDQLVGSCFGFFYPPERQALHSHIAGVLPQARRRNIGFALKLHQRAWAMARGVHEICWTYDPLIRRNAYFNIAKLAAEPAAYLPDFYGPIDDGINRSDDSDRILVRWRLDSHEVESACAGAPRLIDAEAARADGATVALHASATGAPLVTPVGSGARTVLVAVPEDIEALREKDPACAALWRKAVRDVLGGLLDHGARVRGFDRAGWYVVDLEAPTPARAAARQARRDDSHRYETLPGDTPQETA